MDNNKIEAHIWRLASVTTLGAIMSILDTTIVNVALDKLSQDLHATIGQIQWVATGYLLALASVIPLTGWAARRVGTRRLYLISLVLFTGGSTLCGFAWSSGSLDAFRVLQGFGGGMLMPVGQMMMARAAGPQRMGRVMGIVSMPIMLAPIFGPTIGGLIIDNLSWRWIFFVNIPVGIVAFLLGLRFLPRDEEEEAGPIDLVGFALLGLGVPALTYGLAEFGQSGRLLAPRAIVPILAGLVLTAAFARHALRARKPLLDIRLFRNGPFSAAALTTFCLGGALFGAMILLPLYFQTVRGESAVVTGLLLAPQGLGMTLIMPIVGRLTDRLGGGILAFWGVVITAVSTLPFAFVDEHTSFLVMSLALVVRGIGIGGAFMPAMAAAYAVLRTEQVIDATPQLNVIQRVGGSIGTAIFAVILSRDLKHADGVHGLAGAYGSTYWWVVAVTALAAVPALVLTRAERARRRERAVTAPAETPAVELA